MSPHRVPISLALLAAGLVATSCDWNPTGPPASDLSLATNPGDFCQVNRFDAGNFSHPARVDNRFLPMVPGTQLILEGQANRGAGERPHRVVFTVTDLTKRINGVRAVVIWDRDIDQGQLTESELAFFAQDDGGNVWNVGEYPEEYEDGKFAGAPSTWIAGVARAKAGLHMRGHPGLDRPRYLQGSSPGIDFLDCAKVVSRELRICVPGKCYEHVLVTDENSPLDPESGHQRKFHAPGVGIIKVAAVGDPEAETLALVKIVRLNPRELEEVSERVLQLERRAYRISEVYRQTQPVQRRNLALQAP
ncbi:MAG: hypothetical protein ACREOQ_08115 [Gemmatimonadales bacterium]